MCVLSVITAPTHRPTLFPARLEHTGTQLAPNQWTSAGSAPLASIASKVLASLYPAMLVINAKLAQPNRWPAPLAPTVQP